MKNLLNAITAILIILFFGWQFCGSCCKTKCDKSKVTKECPHANNDDANVNVEEDTLTTVEVQIDWTDSIEIISEEIEPTEK